MTAGYPALVIYLTLALGLPAAMGWPKKTFFAVVFLLSSADSQAFTQTRTSLFGPYLNANDACTLIAITALFSNVLLNRKAIRFPYITIAIFTSLAIGFLVSYFKMGWSYEVLRITRWGITLPIFFIIAANFIEDHKDVKTFLMAMFIGALISSLQHLFFIFTKIDSHGSSDLQVLRTVAFRSPGVWFLVASAIFLPTHFLKRKSLYFICLSFFFISIAFNQTRSIIVSSVLAFVIAFVFYRNIFQLISQTFLKFIIGTAIIGTIAFFSFQVLFPEIRVGLLLFSRFQSLSTEQISRTKHDTSITRLLAYEQEMKAFKNSSIIFGSGLWYFKDDYYKKIGKNRIAWNHLGHITILAQLGLFGSLIFSVFLPLQILSYSKRLWETKIEHIQFLGVLGGVCMISNWTMFMISDNFLLQKAIEGALFGAIWVVRDSLRREKRLSS